MLKCVVAHAISCKPWELPAPALGPDELIVLWCDGSRGDHGIAGAATVSLLRSSSMSAGGTGDDVSGGSMQNKGISLSTPNAVRAAALAAIAKADYQ